MEAAWDANQLHLQSCAVQCTVQWVLERERESEVPLLMMGGLMEKLVALLNQ